MAQPFSQLKHSESATNALLYFMFIRLLLRRELTLPRNFMSSSHSANVQACLSHNEKYTIGLHTLQPAADRKQACCAHLTKSIEGFLRKHTKRLRYRPITPTDGSTQAIIGLPYVRQTGCRKHEA